MSDAPVKTNILARSSRILGMAAGVASREARHKIKRALRGSAESLGRDELQTRIAQARLVADDLGKLKGAVMKAGQLLSLDASDFLPPEAIDILAKLQGKAEPVPFETLESVLRTDLGEGALARFDVLDREPAASASIGQVHRGVVRGREVALKIQYPGIAESIDSDLAMLEKVASSWMRLGRKKIELSELFEELAIILHLEADYEREAESLREYAALLENDERFVVPEVLEDLCGERVLCMSWEEGVPLHDWVRTHPSVREREWFARAILDLYCMEFFDWGFVQTDPNHANFLVRPADRQIVLLDFGATLRYPRGFIESYSRLLGVLGSKDSDAIVRAAIEFGILDPREPTEPRRLLAEMLISAMEPFEPKMQPFRFRDEDYAERSRDATLAFTRSLVYTPPPKRLLFLHRKLGGIFQMLRRLDVELDLLPYWNRMVGTKIADAV